MLIIWYQSLTHLLDATKLQKKKNAQDDILIESKYTGESPYLNRLNSVPKMAKTISFTSVINNIEITKKLISKAN